MNQNTCGEGDKVIIIATPCVRYSKTINIVTLWKMYFYFDLPLYKNINMHMDTYQYELEVLSHSLPNDLMMASFCTGLNGKSWGLGVVCKSTPEAMKVLGVDKKHNGQS